MKAQDLYKELYGIYIKEKGERFFSFSLVWACLTEKHGKSTALRFSPYELDKGLCSELKSELTRLCAGYPLQYYLGKWEFRSHEYLCRENVLIPREDTALLCELAVEALPERGTVYDFCCGSGCVGISVLLDKPLCRGESFDISPHALSLSRENARRLKVDDRLEVRELDIFSPEAEELIKKADFDVFCCNPPYIRSSVIPTLEDNVKNEPSLALDGGSDGLSFYKRIARLCILACGKPFICEIGFDQREAVENICRDLGIAARFYKDLSGNDRCVRMIKHC